jgi:hypothetical protein
MNTNHPAMAGTSIITEVMRGESIDEFICRDFQTREHPQSDMTSERE